MNMVCINNSSKLPNSIQAANQYKIWLKQEQQLLDWDIWDQSFQPLPECDYFGAMLRAFDQKYSQQGLTVYLTTDLQTLPSYGQNVVAIVYADEQCKVPAYFDRVLAIFKCYGIKPTLSATAWGFPNTLRLLTWLHFFKVLLARFPSAWRYRLGQLKAGLGFSQTIAPVYEIPLGYYKQLDLPIKPWQERSQDIFFGGSLENQAISKRSLKYWLSNPKRISRSQMLAQLDTLQQNHPQLQVGYYTTAGFIPGYTAHDQSSQYSEQMMNAKICLVPRGTSLETYRFFEAIRYGCIPVTETLPQHWFYQGSPAIVLRDWQALESKIQPLLDDPVQLQAQHEAALNWWHNQCSPEKVADFMTEMLSDGLKKEIRSVKNSAPNLSSYS
jgi:hypothetical protein